MSDAGQDLLRLAKKYDLNIQATLQRGFKVEDVYADLQKLEALDQEYGGKYDVARAAQAGYKIDDIRKSLIGEEPDKIKRAIASGIAGPALGVAKTPFSMMGFGKDILQKAAENIPPVLPGTPSYLTGKAISSGLDLLDPDSGASYKIPGTNIKVQTPVSGLTEAQNRLAQDTKLFKSPHQFKETWGEKLKSPTWIMSSIEGALPSLATMLGLSGPKAAKFGWAAMMEGASSYDQLKQWEKDNKKQLPFAHTATVTLASGIINGMLEEAGAATVAVKRGILQSLIKETAKSKSPKAMYQGVMNVVKGTFKDEAEQQAVSKSLGEALKKVLAAQGGEAGTEAAQNTVSNLLAKTYDPNQKLSEGLLESAVGGAGAATIITGAQQAAQKPWTKKVNPKDLEGVNEPGKPGSDKPLSEEGIAKINKGVDEIRKQESGKKTFDTVTSGEAQRMIEVRREQGDVPGEMTDSDVFALINQERGKNGINPVVVKNRTPVSTTPESLVTPPTPETPPPPTTPETPPAQPQAQEEPTAPATSTVTPFRKKQPKGKGKKAQPEQPPPPPTPEQPPPPPTPPPTPETPPPPEPEVKETASAYFTSEPPPQPLKSTVAPFRKKQKKGESKEKEAQPETPPPPPTPPEQPPPESEEPVYEPPPEQEEEKSEPQRGWHTETRIGKNGKEYKVEVRDLPSKEGNIDESRTTTAVRQDSGAKGNTKAEIMKRRRARVVSEIYTTGVDEHGETFKAHEDPKEGDIPSHSWILNCLAHGYYFITSKKDEYGGNLIQASPLGYIINRARFIKSSKLESGKVAYTFRLPVSFVGITPKNIPGTVTFSVFYDPSKPHFAPQISWKANAWRPPLIDGKVPRHAVRHNIDENGNFPVDVKSIRDLALAREDVLADERRTLNEEIEGDPDKIEDEDRRRRLSDLYAELNKLKASDAEKELIEDKQAEINKINSDFFSEFDGTKSNEINEAYPPAILPSTPAPPKPVVTPEERGVTEIESKAMDLFNVDASLDPESYSSIWDRASAGALRDIYEDFQRLKEPDQRFGDYLGKRLKNFLLGEGDPSQKQTNKEAVEIVNSLHKNYIKDAQESTEEHKEFLKEAAKPAEEKRQYITETDEGLVIKDLRDKAFGTVRLGDHFNASFIPDGNGHVWVGYKLATRNESGYHQEIYAEFIEESGKDGIKTYTATGRTRMVDSKAGKATTTEQKLEQINGAPKVLFDRWVNLYKYLSSQFEAEYPNDPVLLKKKKDIEKLVNRLRKGLPIDIKQQVQEVTKGKNKGKEEAEAEAEGSKTEVAAVDTYQSILEKDGKEAAEEWAYKTAGRKVWGMLISKVRKDSRKDTRKKNIREEYEPETPFKVEGKYEPPSAHPPTKLNTWGEPIKIAGTKGKDITIETDLVFQSNKPTAVRITATVGDKTTTWEEPMESIVKMSKTEGMLEDVLAKKAKLRVAKGKADKLQERVENIAKKDIASQEARDAKPPEPVVIDLNKNETIMFEVKPDRIQVTYERKDSDNDVTWSEPISSLKELETDPISLAKRMTNKTKSPLTKPKLAIVTEALKGLADTLEKGSKDIWKDTTDYSKMKMEFVPGSQAILAATMWGTAKIIRGTVRFTEWAQAMVAEFGEAIRPHLTKIWAKCVSEVQQACKQANVEMPELVGPTTETSTFVKTSKVSDEKDLKKKESSGKLPRKVTKENLLVTNKDDVVWARTIDAAREANMNGGTSASGNVLAVVESDGVVKSLVGTRDATNKDVQQAVMQARMKQAKEIESLGGTLEDKANIITGGGLDPIMEMYNALDSLRKKEVDALPATALRDKMILWLRNKRKLYTRDELAEEQNEYFISSKDPAYIACRAALQEPFNLKSRGGRRNQQSTGMSRREVFEVLEQLIGSGTVETQMALVNEGFLSTLNAILNPFSGRGGITRTDEQGHQTVVPSLRTRLSKIMTSLKGRANVFVKDQTYESGMNPGDILVRSEQESLAFLNQAKIDFYRAVAKIPGLRNIMATTVPGFENRQVNKKLAKLMELKHFIERLSIHEAKRAEKVNALKNAKAQLEELESMKDKLEKLQKGNASPEETISRLREDLIKDRDDLEDINESMCDALEDLRRDKEVLLHSGKTGEELASAMDDLATREKNLQEELVSLARDQQAVKVAMAMLGGSKTHVGSVYSMIKMAIESRRVRASKYLNSLNATINEDGEVVERDTPNIGGKTLSDFQKELESFKRQFPPGGYELFEAAAKEFVSTINDAANLMFIEAGVFTEGHMERLSSQPWYFKVHWAKYEPNKSTLLYRTKPIVSKDTVDGGMSLNPMESIANRLVNAYKTRNRAKAFEALIDSIHDYTIRNSDMYGKEKGMPFGFVPEGEVPAVQNSTTEGIVTSWHNGRLVHLRVPKWVAMDWHTAPLLQIMSEVKSIRNISAAFAMLVTVLKLKFVLVNAVADGLRSMGTSQGGITAGKLTKLSNYPLLLPDILIAPLVSAEMVYATEGGKGKWKWADSKLMKKFKYYQDFRKTAFDLLAENAYNTKASVLFSQAKGYNKETGMYHRYMPEENDVEQVRDKAINLFTAMKYLSLVSEPAVKILTAERYRRYLEAKHPGWTKERIMSKVGIEANYYGGSPPVNDAGTLPKIFRAAGTLFVTPTIQAVAKDLTRLTAPLTNPPKTSEDWGNLASTYLNLALIAGGMMAAAGIFFGDDDEGKRRQKIWIDELSDENAGKYIPVLTKRNMRQDKTFTTEGGDVLHEKEVIKMRDMFHLMWSAVMFNMVSQEDPEKARRMLKTAALNYFGIPYTQGSWWDKFAARMEPLKTIYMATSMRDPSTGRDLETEEMKNHPADKRISKNQKTGAVYTGKDSILISNIAFKIADFLGYKEELLSGSQAGFLMSPNGIEKVFMPWAPYRAEFARPLGLKGITLDRSKAANTPGLNALYADPFYDNTAKAKNLNLKDERGYSPGQRVKETDDKLFPLFKKRFEKDIPETKFQVHLAAIYLEQQDKDKSVKDYESLARKYMTKMTADYNPILKKLDELPPNYITNWDSRNKVLMEYNKEAGFTTAEQVREAYTKQRENKKITKEEYYYAMSHAEQIAGDNKYPMKVNRR